MMDQLFSYTKNEHITLEAATNLDDSNFYEMFHLPMSSIAVQQSTQLRTLINDRGNQTEMDSWKFHWGGSNYSK